MTQQTEVQWSRKERDIAEVALKNAYAREVEDLIKGVREQASLVSTTDHIWHLHDFLSARRHEIDGKYDNRESFLIFTLSRLIKDGLLDLSELDGLEADKRAKVRILTRM